MKTILSLIALLISAHYTRAQVLKPNKTVLASHSIFKTQESHKSMFIKNSNNKLDKQVLGAESDNADSDFTDKNSLVKCFRLVFTTTRLKQLLPEHGIFINSYLNSSGKILEVSFVVNQNTTITASELEQLEDLIKKNVTYKISPGALKENKVYNMGINQKFEKVLQSIN